MLLAAGRGERMRPLTDFLPKPLLDVGNQPLIAHHLDALATAGIREVAINLAYRGEQIRQALGNGDRWGLHIGYFEEGPSSLDTGGGILNALSFLGPMPFAVINADVWCDYPFTRLHAIAATLTETTALAHLILVTNPSHHPHGDFYLNQSQIVPTGDEKRTFSGLSVLHPALFTDCSPGRFSVVPLLRQAVERGQVTGEYFDGQWHDIGTPERLHALRCNLATTSR